MTNAQNTFPQGAHSHSFGDAGAHSHSINVQPDAGHTHSIAMQADPGHSHTIATPAAQVNSAATSRPGVVVLDVPITRGDTKITEIVLRKPSAGELRGTSLNALVNLDVDALAKVLPRISMLNEFDVQQLDPADLVQLGVAFAGFLLPKRAS
ncbi:UNVERIFIED_ORG: hypothetical protein ABIC54_006568 [Burkholderia sp. 1263]